MNKKALFKIMTCALICLCFVVVGNHMPLFMRAVYNAIFGEFDHVSLFFAMGVLLLESVILRKWGNDRQCGYLCLGMTIITATFILFSGNTSFVDKLAPSADTTLIGRAVTDGSIEYDDIQPIFSEYFFENKNLIISAEERNREEYQFLYKIAVPAKRIVAGQDIVLSDREAEELLLRPYYRKNDSCYFVLDDFWEKTDNIRLAVWGDERIFCSEEMLANVQNFSGAQGMVPEAERADAARVMKEMAENRPYKEVKQIVAMLLLLLIGGAVSLPLWGEEHLGLSFFLGLPIGAAIWCICGVVLMMLNIPYCFISMLACIALFLAIWLYRKRAALRRVDWQIFLNYMLVAVTVIVFFTYYKVCYTSDDSFTKCGYGLRLAHFGSVRDILEDVAPIGMLEPMIMSIGYLLHCDTLYAFYPLMAICGAGIMILALHCVNSDKENYMSDIVLGAGMLFLFTNFDFVLSAVVMLAHGPTAVYTLILLAFVVLKKEINISGFEWIVAMASAMIILTRVEGAVYVLFFLALSLGIEDETLHMFWVNLAVAGIIVIWNVYQMIIIGSLGDPLFWTPSRGILLMAGAVTLMAMTWLIHKRWVWMNYLRKHYFLLVLCGLCLALIFVVIFAKKGMASTNLPVYLSHFSNNERMNDRINAGAIWTYILLLCPIVMRGRSRMGQYTVSVIVGNILLLFLVCLFREGVSLHYGYLDSARRTLVQIMPSAIWLLACSLRDKKDILKTVKN